jgi:hypothetical protein
MKQDAWSDYCFFSVQKICGNAIDKDEPQRWQLSAEKSLITDQKSRYFC